MIELPDRARNQQHGNEHRRQHQRGGHDGSCQFRHGVLGSLLGRCTTLDPPGDVFTDHDRVIDDDPRGQHQAEQDQAVEVAAAEPHHGETSNQGDRYGDAGNHRQPPAAEHQQQHRQHQQNGIAQRGDGPIEVVLHAVGNVHDQRHLETRREARFQPLQLTPNGPAHLQGIGAIALVQPDGDGALSRQVHRLTAVAALPQVHPSDILQAHQPAVVQTGQHQVLQLPPTAQAAFRLHRQADRLGADTGRGPEAADGGQHVLLRQGPTHIGAGEIHLLQSVRIQPQPKGELTAAKHPDVADAWSGQEGITQGFVEPAAQKGGDVVTLWVTETQDHQQIIRGAPHPQPLATDGLRQAPTGQIHLVLNLDGVQLGVAAAEAKTDAGATLAAAGADALQPFQAVELLFKDGGHALFHHLRRSGWEAGTHADPRRCKRWQVLQPQAGQSHQSSEQDQQAADDGENRSPQKRLGDRPHRDDSELAESCQ